MSSLTRREWLILTFVTHYLAQHGRAPSHRQIARGTGKQAGMGITRTLLKLQQKGIVTLGNPCCAPTIRVVRGVTVGWQP